MGIADASAAPAARHHAPPGGAALAIKATGLVKRFGATPALAGVDLAVAAGTVYGLLAPNGAGENQGADPRHLAGPRRRHRQGGGL